MTMVPKYPIGAHLLVNQGEFLSFAAPWLAAQECDGHRVVVVEHHECPFSDDILYALACKTCGRQPVLGEEVLQPDFGLTWLRKRKKLKNIVDASLLVA